MCSKDEDIYLGKMFLIFIPLALNSFISYNNADSKPITHIFKNTLDKVGILSSLKQCCGN